MGGYSTLTSATGRKQSTGGESTQASGDVDRQYQLGGLFSTVIWDEAQALRYLETQVSLTARSLAPTFNLCISATPIFNRREDFADPLTLSDDDPEAWKQLCPALILRYILDPRIPDTFAGFRLGKIWRHCMIKRSFMSAIPFGSNKTIGSSIPPVVSKVINTRLTKEERLTYEREAQPLLAELLRRLPNRKVVWRAENYRKLVLLSTWLPFIHVHQTVMAPSLRSATEKAYEKTLVYRWAKLINKKLPEAEVPAKSNYSKQLELLLRGSPRLRELLPLVCDRVLRKADKVTVFVLLPAQGVYLAAAFYLVGIDARFLHSGLKQEEREELVRTFTEDRKGVMVLILTYRIGNPGRIQAIGRLQRVDQRYIVLVHELHVANTFNTMLVQNKLKKAIPSMTAELSQEIFSMCEQNGDIDLGQWAIGPEGALVKRGEDLEEVADQVWLSGVRVIQELLQLMDGKE
ncbi:hypothetical protein McanCB49686_002759 [Microsporum canis]